VSTRNPSHHPSAELLSAAASGALTPAVNRIVTAHAALCPHCRATTAKLETLGGVGLEQEASADLAPNALENALAAIAREPSVSKAPHLPEPLAALPREIREFVAPAFGKRAWRSGGIGFKIFDLDLPETANGESFQLFRIEPGSGPPLHTHDGLEFTLVLTGAFKDETGLYRPGDLETGDQSLTHRPVAEAGEVCFALAVTTAPLKFKGTLGLLQRVLNLGK
jgi:putative transcriptional regulator